MLIKRVIDKCLRKSISQFSKDRVNWWRTLLVNFYFLPFEQARKLPIFIYGNLRFANFSGRIKILCDNSDLTKGMIKINRLHGGPGAPGGDTVIDLSNGEIVFRGPINMFHNGKIMIWNNGSLEFGKNVHLGSGYSIGCCKKISIGDYSRTGCDIQLNDTDFHFTCKTEDLIIKNNSKPIILGHHTWIASNSKIFKGVIFPPHTSVASNSLVNKNLVTEEYCLLAGCPAKLIKIGFMRVFNYTEECKIAGFFNKNPKENEYKLTEPLSQYD